MSKKIITLYSGSIGLNIKLDPQRLSQEEDKIEFSQAVNASIDDRGLVTLRNGNILLTTGAFHSLFCFGGDCFVIQERSTDAAIMRVNSDFTLTGIRSSLTKNLRMTWSGVNGDTFYSNGTQNGFIRAGISSAWPANTYIGPTADMQFTSVAPIANHMAFIQGGKCILARGKDVFINHEAFKYGLFSLRYGAIGFESNVTMLCPVQSGFFASDGSSTWFFRQLEEWYHYKQELVDNASVIEGSLAHDRVMLRDIGFDVNGFGRVWASMSGICLGMDDGTMINLTKEKVKYPTGYSFGACLVKNNVVINTAY